MELGVRDWMILLGVLLIVAVLLDGYRRMRNERRGNIRMALNKQFLNTDDGDEYTSELTGGARSIDSYPSELPGGGARSIDRGYDGDFSADAAEQDINTAQVSAALDDDDALSVDSDAGPALGYGDLQLPTAELDLEQAVPLLMESVAGDAPVDVATPAPSPADTRSPQPSPAPKQQPVNEEVVVVNVVAKDAPFKGPDLLHILLACDLRFGEMNVFHRHERANGSGAVQFSMTNSVEPGTFDLDAIDDFTTPGVCFFMSVPGPEDSLKAFECMVETAQCLVSNLGGEMRDESRSVMTKQTLEHCRQRLHDFERRQLAQSI